jgi:hypothetical protein
VGVTGSCDCCNVTIKKRKMPRPKVPSELKRKAFCISLNYENATTIPALADARYGGNISKAVAQLIKDWNEFQKSVDIKYTLSKQARTLREQHPDRSRCLISVTPGNLVPTDEQIADAKAAYERRQHNLQVQKQYREKMKNCCNTKIIKVNEKDRKK